jgi:integrin alpha FG-GAP repeat containing protein 1
MFFDINGDMKTDMVYIGIDANKKKAMMIALGDSFNSTSFTFKPLIEFFLSSSEDKTCLDPNLEDMISNPHSNSFLDLNGDCIPDIFLTKESIDKKTGAKSIYNEIYL